MFVSVAVPADMTLADAHELASRLEDDIRDGQSHVEDVVVHTEPECMKRACRKAALSVSREILRG